MPRSSTSVMGLDDEKARQELRPRGLSSILSSVIKDAFAKLHLLAMLPLRSVNTALSQLSSRLRHTSIKVPILTKQQSVDMRKSVSTWIFGIRQFLFNTGPLHASANP